MQLVISHNIPIAVGKSRLYQEGINLAHKNHKQGYIRSENIPPLLDFNQYIYIPNITDIIMIDILVPINIFQDTNSKCLWDKSLVHPKNPKVAG
jgi:hypothetical protein